VIAFLAGFGLSFLTMPERQVQTPAPQPADVAEAPSTEELGLQLEATQRRSQARLRIAQDLIADRLTLLEAAEHFRDLNEGMSAIQREQWREQFHGATDQERHCWQVLLWVDARLHQDPPRALAVVSRLEAELRTHLKQETLKLR
jgi:hypothetical protein